MHNIMEEIENGTDGKEAGKGEEVKEKDGWK